jgi:hypothetical protein
MFDVEITAAVQFGVCEYMSNVYFAYFYVYFRADSTKCVIVFSSVYLPM